MDINMLAALIQLAERAPLFAAERLWLDRLKADVQAQLDAQNKQAEAQRLAAETGSSHGPAPEPAVG